ncbi:MAG: SCO family protein [Bacteroidales bacterium]|nr:SCO family protein [Bacteroidales bacterium]MCU0407335.1 SCO family protein [Bacteroidales bacterium]
MKRIFSMAALILVALAAMSQEMKKSTVIPSDMEIGIIEHLGDTIPMDLWFLNEENDTVVIGDLIDKPTILLFVYFDCPFMCSPLMDGVAEVVSNLDMNLGTDYQIITISFNTKDTPEKAREKKVNFVQRISKENQKHWMYLTGTQENITQMTEALGFRYKAQGLDFAHASAIMLISPHGIITRYLYGLSFLPFDLKMAIIEAQKDIARPTINKILEYCFAYNPSSKTYTIQITRIVGTFTIAIALIVLAVLILKRKKK